MPEIDPNKLDAAALSRTRQGGTENKIDTVREVPMWERDDAPAGSTEASLKVFENGVPVRISGPTHHTHLADGRIVGGYGIGTHYSEANDDGTDSYTRIIASYGG